jgi:small subunit ribosomal protein S16
MPVKIRLQRKGRRKAPFYHIVVADARAPRDGKYIENIGSYNPMTVPATIELDRDKAYNWLMDGAQPTETMRAILSFKGVLFRKHLMRGVKKGAMTLEEAEAKYQEYIDAKDAKVEVRRQAALEEKRARWAAINGTAPKKEEIVVEEAPVEEAPVEEVSTEEAAPAVEEEAAKSTEETPAE